MAVFDFGVKYNILRCLEKVGCEVLVLPALTSAETVRDIAPDGIFRVLLGAFFEPTSLIIRLQGQ